MDIMTGTWDQEIYPKHLVTHGDPNAGGER